MRGENNFLKKGSWKEWTNVESEAPSARDPGPDRVSERGEKKKRNIEREEGRAWLVSLGEFQRSASVY